MGERANTEEVRKICLEHNVERNKRSVETNDVQDAKKQEKAP